MWLSVFLELDELICLSIASVDFLVLVFNACTFFYDGKMENQVGFNFIVHNQGSVFCQLQTLVTTLLCMGHFAF